jgi:hypothetical protein
MSGCAPSSAALAVTRKIAGLLAPALAVILGALTGSEVAHFDETGFLAAGKLAWVHSASSGKFVLVTVHSKRGTEGMGAAGVLQSFTGIACHDAWKPYDSYQAGGHALCNAHLPRELTAVTETGTEDDVIWARQAIDALLALNRAAYAARAAGRTAVGAEVLENTAAGSAARQQPGSSSVPAAAAGSRRSACPGHPDARPAGGLPEVRP